MAMIRILLFLFLSALPAAASETGGAPTDCPGPSADGSKLAVYLTCPSGGDEATGCAYRLGPDGPVHVLDASRLGLGVDEARARSDESGPSVFLKLDKGSACRFKNLTAAHVGETLAVAFEGRILIAPVIREAISNGEMVLTAGAGKTLKDTEALCRRIHPGCRTGESWWDRVVGWFRGLFG